MKGHITAQQLAELSETAQQRLSKWFTWTRFDRDCVHVYIPEEAEGENGGEFEGYRDDEQQFIYPDEYTGKLRFHEGTILPLMDVTLLWWYLEDAGLPHPQQTVDELWAAVREHLETPL